MLFQNSQGLGDTVGKHLDSLQHLPLLTRHEIPAAVSKMKECVCVCVFSDRYRGTERGCPIHNKHRAGQHVIIMTELRGRGMMQHNEHKCRNAGREREVKEEDRTKLNGFSIRQECADELVSSN